MFKHKVLDSLSSSFLLGRRQVAKVALGFACSVTSALWISQVIFPGLLQVEEPPDIPGIVYVLVIDVVIVVNDDFDDVVIDVDVVVVNVVVVM